MHDHRQPEKLYHYTSLDGLRGIAKHALLWASDILRMRTDDRDGKHMFDVIRPIISRTMIDERFKTWLADPANLGLGDAWFIYSASFSTTSTIDSQWRDYAERGTGCAIEVDCASLSAERHDGRAYPLARVLYDEDKQRGIIEEIVKDALRLPRTLGIAADDKDFGIELLRTLIVAGVRFKRSCFAPEDEWRAIMMEPRESAESHPGLHGQVSHQNISVSNGIVRRILRGPACGRTATQLREELDGTAFTGIPIA